MKSQKESSGEGIVVHTLVSLAVRTGLVRFQFQ